MGRFRVSVFIAFLFFLTAASALSLQQNGEDDVEEIVVTATRLSTPVREVGSSITVISGEELKKTDETFLAEALDTVPGLDVVRSGGPGQQTSVFIRGAKSADTLVLIDGLEANDPISPDRAFDFSSLTVDNIERVEILRGPQSTLYGSDAIGGVINIITRKGKGKPALMVSGEYGSFETTRGKVSVRGAGRRLNYSLSLLRFDTRGLSAASGANGGIERDGYENSTISARLGLALFEDVELECIARHIDAETNIDYSGGLVDDRNSIQKTEEIFVRGQVTFPFLEGKWENVAGLGLAETDRENRDELDGGQLFLNRGSFRGKLIEADWQGSIFIHETNILTLGIELQEESGASSTTFGEFPRESTRNQGYYIQDQINLWNRLFTTVGGRIDHFDNFGNEFTYRVAISYDLEQSGTRFRGTVGTGFKAPSLFQLFDPAFGNPDLRPEESMGWDLGIEQDISGGRVKAGITYFRNDFEEQIDFVFTDPVTFEGEFINTGKSSSEGVEVFAIFTVVDPLAVTLNYTYTEATNRETGEFLLKRPRNKFSFIADYDFIPGGNIFGTVTYTGKRHDIDPITFGRTVVDGYTLVNVAASYDLSSKATLFSRIDNLFDEIYEVSSGFGTAGISVYLGLAVTI